MSKKSRTTDDIKKDVYEKEAFYELLDLFFERNNEVLTDHHITSFNQFIEEGIPNILQNSPNIISDKITESKRIVNYLKFENCSIHPPSSDNDEGILFPLDAIQKKLSYSSLLTSVVTQYQDIIDINSGDTTTTIISGPEPGIAIGKIPIMVRSAYCNLIRKPSLQNRHCKYDAGGYFIINGNEKVVLSIETSVFRKPMVFIQTEQNTSLYYARVNSKPATQIGNMQIFNIKIRKDNSIVLNISQFKEVSIFTLMRALGLETDSDIVRVIADSSAESDKSIMNHLIIAMNTQNSPSMSREEAIETMISNLKTTKIYTDTDPVIKAKQKRAFLMKILSETILPHVTSDTKDPQLDMYYKAVYIGYMIRKLLKCYLTENKDTRELKGCDDRDSMINKRIETTGVLLMGLFEKFFNKMISDCNKVFKQKNVDDKNIVNIIPHIRQNSIEQGLRQALSTGNFGTASKKGLSQPYNRMNHLQAASYLRRIIFPIADASNNKLTGPRHLHNTQFPYICPVETPEGPKTGIVKSLSMLTSITVDLSSQIPIIKKYVVDKIISLEQTNDHQLHKYVKVFLNGSWLGVTSEIIKIHKGLKNMRFKGEISKFVSLTFEPKEKEYHIYTEAGRLYRPYLTVDDNELNFKPDMVRSVTSWEEFISKYSNVIEYIDINEAMGMMLAMFPEYLDKDRGIMNKRAVDDIALINKINTTNRYDDYTFVRYTHCEINPAMVLGLISNNIPFPNHNQSPRVIFQYNQARQAMGLFVSDYRERTDISYILYHSQIPIVTSRTSKYTGTHIFPAGENIIVAIASYTGLNQEDSILFNSSAIEKGLFRAQALKKYLGEIKKNPAASQVGTFMKPDANKVDGMKDANYGKLSEKGYAKPETVVKDNDIIIGIVNPKPAATEDEKMFKDGSTIYKSLIPGTIDKVITGYNSDCYPIIQMRVRSERIPQIGDKFSCYDGETEILTTDGWVLFTKLTRNHEVATLVDGKTLVYEKPSALHEYDFVGDMYQIKSDQVDLLVTPNHKMWVANKANEYGLKVAEDIIGKKYNYQKSAKESLYTDLDTFIVAGTDTLPDLAINMDTWLTFIGIWYAKGYIKNEYAVGFMVDNDKIKMELIRCAREMNLEIISKRKNLVNDEKNLFDIFYFTDKRLINYFKPYNVKDENKTFPDWILELSVKQSKLFINNMLICDDNNNIFTTSSVDLANSFQTLCLHGGLSCNIGKETRGVYSTTISGRKLIYYITIYNLVVSSQNYPGVNEETQDAMIPYAGKVYCCTVTSGVIYVRRNGIPVWSGNSRAGQKGTMGHKFHRADMPFTTSGLIPDAIINPNCIPKRMTIGQLIECLLAKVCAIKGVFGDATPFVGVDIDKINKELVDAGWEEWANDTMYNGMTGQKMKSKIFIGPTYYQRLKQMVGDKAHSRAGGPTQVMTRQPTEGRVREGGFRIGEMERDVLCAHGIAQFQKERYIESSDIYPCHICDICGMFAFKEPGYNYYKCRNCVNSSKISKIIIPYCFKLFLQELASINILGRIRTSNSIILPSE